MTHGSTSSLSLTHCWRSCTVLYCTAQWERCGGSWRTMLRFTQVWLYCSVLLLCLVQSKKRWNATNQAVVDKTHSLLLPPVKGSGAPLPQEVSRFVLYFWWRLRMIPRRPPRTIKAWRWKPQQTASNSVRCVASGADGCFCCFPGPCVGEELASRASRRRLSAL